MKRSASVRLTLMSAVAAGGLTACGDEVPAPGNYTTLESCISAGNSSKACSSAREEAAKAHEEKAPRFATREECLKGVDVTECQETKVKSADGTSLTSMFIPAVAGFALARAIQRQQPGSSSYYTSYGGGPFYGSRDYPNQYRDLGNMSGSRTSSGGFLGAPSGTGTQVSSFPSRPPNVSTTTISRGGFGSSSSFSSGSS